MDVFVYGTLTDATRAASLLDDFAYVGAATLSGLHRIDGRYPTLAPGGSVAGRLLRTDEIETLDGYEGVERGLYVRVSVSIEGDHDRNEAAVYVGDPALLDAPADWPGEGDFAARVRRYVREQAVRLTLD